MAPAVVIRSDLLLAVAAGLLLPWPALARKAAPVAATRRVQVKREPLLRGLHLRLSLPQGVLHVFRPPGYRQARAGTVLYVHGYGTSADETFQYHRLAQQFVDSKQNALFIVVDGPREAGQRVRFPAMGEVFALVRRHARLAIPPGPVVAMAHSSGVRTVLEWLDHRALGHVILLDALFGHTEAFRAWMSAGPRASGHRLTLVGESTAAGCQALASKLPGGMVRRNIPARFEDLKPAERKARVLALRAQYGHAELVTGRKVIPVVVRRTRLRPVRGGGS